MVVLCLRVRCPTWPYSRETAYAAESFKLPRPLSASGSLRPFAGTTLTLYGLGCGHSLM
jgi:hypothetical protein